MSDALPTELELAAEVLRRVRNSPDALAVLRNILDVLKSAETKLVNAAPGQRALVALDINRPGCTCLYDILCAVLVLANEMPAHDN